MGQGSSRRLWNTRCVSCYLAWALCGEDRSVGAGIVGQGHEFTLVVLELIGQKPQPEAAINLIHQQPVRWTKERKVSCDGGGGPLGHPRIFINVDKPQICWCTYCGLPFVSLPISMYKTEE